MKNKHLISAPFLVPCSVLARARHRNRRTAGERLSAPACASCHSLIRAKTVSVRIYPGRWRSAGSVAGARYSKALSASGFVWDEERLHAYLNNPRQGRAGYDHERERSRSGATSPSYLPAKSFAGRSTRHSPVGSNANAAVAAVVFLANDRIMFMARLTITPNKGYRSGSGDATSLGAP